MTVPLPGMVNYASGRVGSGYTGRPFSRNNSPSRPAGIARTNVSAIINVVRSE